MAQAPIPDGAVFRVFLKDGRALPSYGESAVTGDRVVFTLIIGSTKEQTSLQLVSLPVSSVDVARTSRSSLVQTDAAEMRVWSGSVSDEGRGLPKMKVPKPSSSEDPDVLDAHPPAGCGRPPSTRANCSPRSMRPSARFSSSRPVRPSTPAATPLPRSC